MLDRPEGGSPVTQVGGRNTLSRCFPIKAPDLTAVPALAAHSVFVYFSNLFSELVETDLSPDMGDRNCSANHFLFRMRRSCPV